MRKLILSCLTVGCTLLSPAAQDYDLLIRKGRLIDPRNEIDAILDLAVSEGKIARIADGIEPSQARLVIDASGLWVTPGLVDLHVHAFYGTEDAADYGGGFSALRPDPLTSRSCVTTAVDAGGAGWRNFRDFKRRVIDRSQTRILAFLNIVGEGMQGGPIEQNLADMDPRLTAMRAREFPNWIIGIKVAHFRGAEWHPVDRAVQAGQMADVPIMVDFGTHDPPLPLDELLLQHLRPGDILTHTYAHVTGRIPLVDDSQRIRPAVWEARGKGVLFDVGHGAGSFLFRQAVPAMQQGFPPDTISTDLHRSSVNAGMKDMPNVMSKFLNMGMTPQQVISASTWKPARAIHRTDLGHLSVGSPADIAIFGLRSGKFGFVDVENRRLTGTHKLDCEVTIREGRILWDLNGLSASDWTEGADLTPH